MPNNHRYYFEDTVPAPRHHGGFKFPSFGHGHHHDGHHHDGHHHGGHHHHESGPHIPWWTIPFLGIKSGKDPK